MLEYEIVDLELSTPAFVAWRVREQEGARPLIILNHAAGQTERMWLDIEAFRILVNNLMDAGYVVAASRMTLPPPNHFDNWGNQVALNANSEMYNYLSTTYGTDNARVGMVGDSMGGLATLLTIPDARVPAKCLALYYPVTSLRGQFDFNSAMATTIKYAYGISEDGSNYQAQTAGHDPHLRPASDWRNVGIRFYGGDGDSLVPWHLHSRLFLAQIAGVAREASAVRLDGDHNAGAETTGADLVSFFGRCLEGR